MEISRKPGKALSVFGLVMINVIAIDSIRNLPISAATGYACVVYYILGSLLFFLPGILVSAELATHYPKTGGSYVWAREAFGPRTGFVAIWLLWIYNVVWYPTIIIILASLVLASLAIAMVVPYKQLNIVSGLVQAFSIFFSNYNLRWINQIITLLIIIGGIGGVAARITLIKSCCDIALATK